MNYENVSKGRLDELQKQILLLSEDLKRSVGVERERLQKEFDLVVAEYKVVAAADISRTEMFVEDAAAESEQEFVN
ncbi:MAG TPA: hypothetical protein VJB98_03755 [Candidatus Paceibacterota bacterium]